MPKLSDRQFLRRRTSPEFVSEEGIRVVDLFSGCGGMTLGAALAAWRLDRAIAPSLELDVDPDAISILQANFGGGELGTVEEWFDGRLGASPTPTERSAREKLGRVDLLLGGPPCQGNSDLNNHTRRDDPRNRLYARMARAAEILKPTFVLVENVPAVIHDRQNVVQVTKRALEGAGYTVWHDVLRLERLGVPQRRRRHFLLASRDPDAEASNLALSIKPVRKQRTVAWAIEDLLAKAGQNGEFGAPGNFSPENRRRMKWLFENDEYVLPDEYRPPCHRDKPHSYKTVYGRMQWEQPAPTITTGFTSMGQGCFVHPKEPRTITPHEAARLQTFPDFFDFEDSPKRTVWSKVIGNAVPPIGVSRLLAPLLLRIPGR